MLQFIDMINVLTLRNFRMAGILNFGAERAHGVFVGVMDACPRKVGV